MTTAWPEQLYHLPQTEKQAWLLPRLQGLTAHHRAHCAEYARIMDGFFEGDAAGYAALPYLTVSLFKLRQLVSVPEAERFKVLTSSGTSGVPSQVVLDKATAGFSLFGADHTYALDADLQPDWQAVEAFLAKHPGEPLFIFGFTFLVWQWVQQAQQRFDLSRAFLLHGGGWKKLQDAAVSPEVFNAALQARFGIAAAHNYYGMVEQVGSIFMGCEAGYLHAPVFADILIRHPQTLEVLPQGEAGAVQLLSAIPTSYPGHSLLSEDEGVIHGVDDCPCGRKGVRFRIHGRLARAELRGCSDMRRSA